MIIECFIHLIQSVSGDVVRSDHLQDQVMALQLKLKEEEIMRKKSAEEYTRMSEEVMKLQTEKKEMLTEKKELQTEKKRLALKNEELNDKLISVQESIVSCPHIIPHYIVHSSLHCTLLTRWCIFCV